MFGRARTLLTIAALALATPVAAQAPTTTTTAFDGTYAGVSRTFEGTMGGGRTRGCQPNLERSPARLTIVNGIARTRWRGTAEGSVTPQGVLVMHDPYGTRIEGQIDSRGTINARLSGTCSWQMVWQKEGK